MSQREGCTSGERKGERRGRDLHKERGGRLEEEEEEEEGVVRQGYGGREGQNSEVGGLGGREGLSLSLLPSLSRVTFTVWRLNLVFISR